MEPSRVNRVLEDWNRVAATARRPAAPPHGVVVRGGLPAASLLGAALIVVAIVFGGMWLGRQSPNGAGGNGSPTPPASSSPTAVETTPTLGPTPTLTPAPTPVPTIGPCDPAILPARITMWEGAAGHRIADVELTNAGSVACLLAEMARPQLVDGAGAVLIDGSDPASPRLLTVAPGAVLTTLVQDGNYCGSTPAPPVTVAFVLGDGRRLVAAPAAPDDATVPPCLGGSGSAPDIEMQAWAP